jgi:hypothetical protein
MAIHDSAMMAGENSQAAKTTQNIAQQGWTGSGTCDDGSDPANGEHTVCENPDGADYSIQGSEQCGPGDSPVVYANDGICSDGTQPKITSPGQITSQMSNTAVKTGQENITSATSIAGLLNALTESLLNSLAQSAINYANSAVNGALNSKNDSGLMGISPTSTATTTLGASSSTQTAVQCLPSVQPATLSTSTPTSTPITTTNLSAGGGAVDTTCVLNNNCPNTENSDGTPIYNWSAPGSTQAASGIPLTGSSVVLSYTAEGTYYATVTASTDRSQSACEIDVQ